MLVACQPHVMARPPAIDTTPNGVMNSHSESCHINRGGQRRCGPRTQNELRQKRSVAHGRAAREAIDSRDTASGAGGAVRTDCRVGEDVARVGQYRALRASGLLCHWLPGKRFDAPVNCLTAERVVGMAADVVNRGVAGAGQLV